MRCEDYISVSRRTYSGSEDEFGQQTPSDTVVKAALCDVQDRPYKWAVDVSGDADVKGFAEVYLDDASNVLLIEIDDDAAVTMGQFGTERTGKVVALNPMDQSVTVRWSS